MLLFTVVKEFERNSPEACIRHKRGDVISVMLRDEAEDLIARGVAVQGKVKLEELPTQEDCVENPETPELKKGMTVLANYEGEILAGEIVAICKTGEIRVKIDDDDAAWRPFNRNQIEVDVAGPEG